jgi:ABC-type transport system involved in multi-copper enzyme maturation permease subunit
MMFFNALATEFVKLRRTKITWIIGILYSFGPLAIAFSMVILKNPELAKEMGLLTAKAQMTIGAVDWPTYMQFTGIILAMGGIVLGLMETFIFGREYAQGTAKNMLTLPIGRSVFVAAKLTVAAVWFTIVAAWLFLESILLGHAIGLSGYSAALVEKTLAQCGLVLIQTLLLGSLPAWMAILGRGLLAPIGFTIFTLLFIGQLMLHTGWAHLCPWSIPLLTTGAGGAAAPEVGAGSWIVLLGTFAVGTAAAIFTLDRVDNTQ